MNELELIERIRKTQPPPSPLLRAGIGEDASVIAFGEKELLVTCDCLVEGVHFKRRWGSWEDWGKKAAGSALSDIAAMGGTVLFAWVDLHLPKNFKEQDLSAFYKGLYSFFIPLKISLAGGNLSQNPKGLSASLTLLGERPAGSKMLRSDARPGDFLFLAGSPGFAGLGLSLLKKKQKEVNRYTQAFLHPQPQLMLGRWLRENQ
ncbi:MAG: thiamine-monophosphate kinase, partial [Deltaproteobacteria bacterium]|nr:thiamine-monophosphate kinase [Deltaproteobacteria bacterium]